MIIKNPDKIKVTIVRGIGGLTVLLNDYRICGPKPWGGGTLVNEWEVDKTEIDIGLQRRLD